MEQFPLKIKIIVPEDPIARTNMIFNYIVYKSLHVISAKRVIKLAEKCKPDLSVIIKRIHSFRLDVDLFNFCEIVNRMRDYGFLTDNDILLLRAEANKALSDNCDCIDIKNTSPLYKRIDTIRTKN